MAVIPRLPDIYDEPFSDSSQIPTFLVSQLARRHVTVSLSGDGGDELFFGYGRYIKAEQLWSKLSHLPVPLRRMVSRVLTRAPGRTLAKAMGLLPGRLRINHIGDRLPKLAELLAHPSGEAFYRELVSHAKNPDQLVVGAHEPDTILSQAGGPPRLPSLRERMMYLDMMTYLPGDILTKVDRASMAVSLEVRCPLLDHVFLEYVARIPAGKKLAGRNGKRIFKQALEPFLPDDILYRRKMGFGVPILEWLREGIREYAEAQILNGAGSRAYFSRPFLESIWREHQRGTRNWATELWAVLMFNLWYARFAESGAPSAAAGAEAGDRGRPG